MNHADGLGSAAAFLRKEINPDVNTHPDEGQDNSEVTQEETLNDYDGLYLPKMQGNIHVIIIIGQVEGHLIMPSQNKRYG